MALFMSVRRDRDRSRLYPSASRYIDHMEELCMPCSVSLIHLNDDEVASPLSLPPSSKHLRQPTVADPDCPSLHPFL